MWLTPGCPLTVDALGGREAVLLPVFDGPLGVPALEAEMLVAGFPGRVLRREGFHLVEMNGHGLLRGHAAPGHHTATLRACDRLDPREPVVLL